MDIMEKTARNGQRFMSLTSERSDCPIAPFQTQAARSSLYNVWQTNDKVRIVQALLAVR